jgi:hypothetical protein
MKLVSFLFICSFLSICQAEDLLDVSTDKIINFTWPETYLALTVTSKCSHCETQLKLLKGCGKTNQIVLFFDNKEKFNSTKLKKYIRSKNWTSPFFLLDDNIKKRFDYKGVTPHLYMKNKKEIKIYNGVISCDELEKFLNF